MSFALNTTASFFLTFIDFIVVLVLFSHFEVLDGWTLQQIALLYGLSGIGIAIADMLIGHIDMIHLDIRSGQFDVVLLRPAGTLLQVMSSDLALRRIGRVTQATVVLVYALVVADIDWTPVRVRAHPGRCRVRCAHLRRDVRARRLPHVLDGRQWRDDERLHLRRQHDDVVPAQHLRVRGCGAPSRSSSRSPS